MNDGQVSWNGLLMGEGTSYGITEINGWLDLPDVVDLSQQRPRGHGEFTGSMWSTGRVVQISGLYYGTKGGTFDTLHQAMMNACALRQDYSDLRVSIHGQELSARARLSKRALPIASSYGYGADRFALEFRCPDPRKYEDAIAATVGLVNNVGGLIYPLAYPLNYGSSPSSSVSATNSGNADSYPNFTVYGPLSGFSIVNMADGRQLSYIDNLGSTDYVTIDTKNRLVKLNGATDRRASLTIAQWWTVEPGATATMLFTTPGAYSAQASLTVELKSAWW